jgi:hypothetical protein
MKTRTKVIIAILVGLFGLTLLISGSYKVKIAPEEVKEHIQPSVIKIEEQNKEETTNTNTNIPKKQKSAKKGVKSSFTIKVEKDRLIEYAKEKVIATWGIEEWQPFYNIIEKESSWNPNAINKKSGACGLFQMKPCSKANKDYKTSYKAQIRDGINYILIRYNKPSNAWKFWQQHKWY